MVFVDCMFRVRTKKHSDEKVEGHDHGTTEISQGKHTYNKFHQSRHIDFFGSTSARAQKQLPLKNMRLTLLCQPKPYGCQTPYEAISTSSEI